MSPIKPEPVIAVVLQFHTVDDVQSSHVCRTLVTDGREKRHCHQNVCLVIVPVAKELVQGTRMCFIDFALSVIQTQDFFTLSKIPRADSDQGSNGEAERLFQCHQTWRGGLQRIFTPIYSLKQTMFGYEGKEVKVRMIQRNAKQN